MNSLKEYREQLGLTQKELAEFLKVIHPSIDRSMISKIESGIAEPSRESLECLKKACAHAAERFLSGGREI